MSCVRRTETLKDILRFWNDDLRERASDRARNAKKKNSITKALLLKDRQNVQDLKLWHQKLFVSFPSYGLQFKWGKEGDEKPGRSQRLLR